MVKIYLLIIVFSNFAFLQKKDLPEQTKFEFPGYTIKKCLGSDLTKPKRQVAKLPSKQAQRYLKELFPYLQADNEDFVKAKNVLDKMQSDASITEADKAQMYYYFAYIASVNDDLNSAKRNYKKFLSIDGADPRLRSNVISMLGQISYGEGNYKTAIDYMEQWIAMEANPSSLGFDIIAASYWQLKDKKKALKFSERALCVAKANKSKPKESTYNLLIALYNENERIKDMLPLFEELVRFYPKKRYWTQLSGVYGELKKESNQLSALEAAHDQRLLDKENEYVSLYQLLMRADAPLKAARVIEYGITNEFVEENEKHLKYLAQGWHMSQELDKAEPVYEKAAIKSEEGELYVFLGQIYLATDRYKKAKQALQLGLKKGKLKDPVTVNILLGQVAYELQDFEDATKFFRTAIDRLSDIKIKNKEAKEKKQDKLRTQALNWLTYTEKEKKRVELLQLRIKDLEEES
jgi:lipopolysaccharide biosynthesis regulator YciM